VKTFGATTARVLALVDYLLSQRVTTVVMEATSDFLKPFYYVMEDTLPVMLVDARHARNIPGRKSDLQLSCMPCRNSSWPLTATGNLSLRHTKRARGDDTSLIKLGSGELHRAVRLISARIAGA
jgi:hypothetical protein